MELSESTILLKSLLLQSVKSRMLKGEVVRFAYMKKDGTVRTAVGTLQENAVKANVTGTGCPLNNRGLFAYIDLEKMQWRSFRKDSFIGTIDSL